MSDGMTPLERAARAACQAAGYDWVEVNNDEYPYPIGDEWRAAARAVLQAIREPSEAMEQAGMDACGGDGSVLDGYEAMIDAALEEG